MERGSDKDWAPHGARMIVPHPYEYSSVRYVPMKGTASKFDTLTIAVNPPTTDTHEQQQQQQQR